MPAFAKNFKGRVTATSGDSFQMTTPDPETLEIQIVAINTGPNTRIEGAGSIQELRVGNPVKVDVVEGPGGSWRADFIGVGDTSSSPSGPSSGGAGSAETLSAQRGDPSLE